MEGVTSRPQSSSIYYEQTDSSRYDVLCYDDPESSESEKEMYEYASPAPLDYEVPDHSSETAPDNQPNDTLPEREVMRPPSHPPPILPVKDTTRVEKQKLTLRELYTTLTHAHVPAVYSTPLHSMEYRTNTVVTDSTLNIINLGSDNHTPPSTPLPKDTLSLSRQLNGHHSRTRAAILFFLLAAVVVGVVSLAVSVIAVFVTRGNSEAGVAMEDVSTLQVEVQQLQMSVELARNQTSGSVDLSALYQSCDTHTSSRVCNPEEGYADGFSCLTDPLSLEQEVCLTLYQPLCLLLCSIYTNAEHFQTLCISSIYTKAEHCHNYICTHV